MSRESPSSGKGGLLAGTRLVVALCIHSKEDATIITEVTFPSDASITIGDATASLHVPGWSRDNMLLIEAGHHLHLGPGMRVNMCRDGGSDRIVGTFDELVASGTAIPIPVDGRRMNILVQNGISIFTKYVGHDEALP